MCCAVGLVVRLLPGRVHFREHLEAGLRRLPCFRNTFRFLLGNLDDFTPDDFVGDWDALEPLDQWALVRLSQLLADVEASYESYRFNSAYRPSTIT